MWTSRSRNLSSRPTYWLWKGVSRNVYLSLRTTMVAQKSLREQVARAWKTPRSFPYLVLKLDGWQRIWMNPATREYINLKFRHNGVEPQKTHQGIQLEPRCGDRYRSLVTFEITLFWCPNFNQMLCSAPMTVPATVGMVRNPTD